MLIMSAVFWGSNGGGRESNAGSHPETSLPFEIAMAHFPDSACPDAIRHPLPATSIHVSTHWYDWPPAFAFSWFLIVEKPETTATFSYNCSLILSVTAEVERASLDLR